MITRHHFVSGGKLTLATIVMLAAATVPACIDPLVLDVVERPDLILPAGTVLPLLADDPVMRAAIDQGDGVDGGRIELLSAFAHGARIWHWDLGPASVTPIPLYILVEKNEQGYIATPQGNFAPLVTHPTLIDAVPGDPGYTPWWIVVLWPVTELYAGQVIGSFEAMDEARRQGLVGDPITLPLAANCPVVLPETLLEMAPGDPSVVVPPYPTYYRGRQTNYFNFAPVFMQGATVPVTPVYVLRRQGSEPLSEPWRGVDMTRDGDLRDSNDLFATAPGDLTYSGMVELIDAVVDADGLIDQRSDGKSELMDAAQLFPTDDDVADDSSVSGPLVALYPRATVVNRPIWTPPLAPP